MKERDAAALADPCVRDAAGHLNGQQEPAAPGTAPAWRFRAEDNTAAFNAILQASILATSENLTDAEAQAMMGRRHAEHASGLADDELLVLLGVMRQKTTRCQNRPVSGRSAEARSNRRQLRGWGNGHTGLLREALRRKMPVPGHLV